MRHIKLENNIPIDYSLEQLFVDVPNAAIYEKSQMPDEKLLANYNVYPLITTPQPALNEDEIAEEATAEFKDGEWQQMWVVRALSEAEIQAIIDSRSTDLIATDDTNIVNSAFFASSTLQTQRYDICKECPMFTLLKTCRECGYIMPLKVKMAGASCPLNKW